jgi:1,4-alpha-glucan branching enzyme
VSRPVYLGGLGFGFKWNMGWMHDTLSYMSKEPVHRKFHHNDLTFGLLYAFSENFVLPISHDEVVHGKGSLINKMPGDVWQKAASLRAYFGFMWTYPGKKLLFMGCEFGQWREWDHDSSLDWHLLDEGPYHRGLHSVLRDLNRLYRDEPALHEQDCEPAGFEWIDCSDVEHSIVAWIRRARDPERFTITVCNFTPVPRQGYRLGVPRAGAYRERINTDAAEYGGSGIGNAGMVQAEPEPCHGRPASVWLTLPPLSTLVLEPA